MSWKILTSNSSTFLLHFWLFFAMAIAIIWDSITSATLCVFVYVLNITFVMIVVDDLCLLLHRKIEKFVVA